MRGSIRQRHAKTRQVISVLGVTEGAGATRLALSIANYYASAEGRKTAYGEISKETKLGYILEKAKCIATEPVGFQDPFLLYYPALGRQGICDLMEQEKHGWERLILDQTLAEDSEIVIGSGAVHILLLDPTLWSYRQIQTEMRNLVTNQRLYRLLKGNAYTYTEDLRAIRRFQDEFGLVLHRIPWIKDPYRMCKGDIKAIQQILTREEMMI